MVSLNYVFNLLALSPSHCFTGNPAHWEIVAFQAYSLELALYKLTTQTEGWGREAFHEMRIIETNLRVKYYNHSQVGFPGVL